MSGRKPFITLYAFYRLYDTNTFRAGWPLCREGVYLSERTNGEYFVALYGLLDFYAEVYCRRPASELVMITSFQNPSQLEPYLAKINLHGILQPVLSP